MCCLGGSTQSLLRGIQFLLTQLPELQMPLTNYSEAAAKLCYGNTKRTSTVSNPYSNYPELQRFFPLYSNELMQRYPGLLLKSLASTCPNTPSWKFLVSQDYGIPMGL